MTSFDELKKFVREVGEQFLQNRPQNTSLMISVVMESPSNPELMDTYSESAIFSVKGLSMLAVRVLSDLATAAERAGDEPRAQACKDLAHAAEVCFFGEGALERENEITTIEPIVADKSKLN